MSNPLSYPRSSEPFSLEEWRDPPAEYRGAPFWSWNTRLSEPELLEQLAYMREKMGMGGAHMHPRTGLDTAYMGEEYLGLMRSCIDFCKENKMLACLYDEDRWPSGAAGGIVTKKNPDYRQGHLLITRYRYGALPEELKLKNPSKGQVQRSENGSLVARFDVSLGADGIASYKRLDDEPDTPDTVLFYYEWQPPEPWWNYGTYVDTLNPDAIALFLEQTHAKYHDKFGDDFGSVIPSIFTDEPQFTCKEYLPESPARKDLFLPWTHDLEATFCSTYGSSLVDYLPELIWDTSLEPSLTRYRFHDHVCERFASAFIDQISTWCRDRKISLTGHMNGEPRLTTQTQYLGEAMRCYRGLDIPGIDILCDGREYNTAKQAVSVARQNGVKGVLSELYGVTNWTFDFTGHKAQGDWQAALGVTFRVPHLFPVSIAGESKRDYPAAIGYQAPWTTEYAYIENHFARVTSCLTRGRPVTKVAVIHPIESFWLAWGPADRNGREQVWREHAFEQLTDWLSHGLIDFDFISESLFEGQTKVDEISDELPVGVSRYQVVIVPNMRTIRRTTLLRLQRFAEKGGKVIVTSGLPTLVDVKQEIVELPAQHVGFTRWEILAALEDIRDIRVLYRGVDTQSLFYQLRRDDNDRFLFLCDTNRGDPIESIVKIRGQWGLTVLDTLQGEDWALESNFENGWTVFPWTFHAAGSLLLRLQARATGGTKQPDYENGHTQIAKVSLNSVSLSEPNVLLLDQAEWRLGSGEWEPKEEVLKIDNVVRGRLGLPLKKDAFPQPWNYSAEERRPVDTLHLRSEFESLAPLEVQLAVELVPGSKIRLDGKEIQQDKVGWFVDKDIPVFELGAVSGRHTLEVDIPFGRTTPLERMYLLGQFSVHLHGDHGLLDEPHLDRVRFGDFTRQGLPFYVGNLTYHCDFDLDAESSVVLQTPKFAGPAVTCSFRGKKYNISLPPHVANIGKSPAGKHQVDFTIYGNRENAFGALHMPPGETDWWNPNSFRGEQNYWQDEYDIKPMGITATPVVRVPGKRVYSVPIRRRHIEQAGIFDH